MKTRASEVKLLKKCLKGNHKAFEVIVAKYQDLVCAITYSGTADVQKSEELAHQTFINAWNKLSQLRDLSKFHPWLCSIARNHVKSFLTKNKRDILQKAKPMEYANGTPNAESGPLESAINKEHIKLVNAAISQIPEQYREALVLYYRQQQSARQVAQSLDLSEEIVKKRLQRGRKMIKGQIRSIVEKTLSATGPKKAFTTAVIASVAGMAIKGSGVAAAAGIAESVTGTATGATAIMSGITAKILTAVGVVAVGVGAVVTYKQVIKPSQGPDSFEIASAVQEENEEQNEFEEETVEQLGDKELKPSIIEANKRDLESKQLINDTEQVKLRPPHGPGGFLLHGAVSDVDTGKPIGGAKVEDDGYAGNEGTVSNSNGSYDYWTWPEEHFVKASIPGYESKRILFKSSLMQHNISGQLNFKLKRIKRLEYSLHPVRKVWQAGENPEFVLDVRNVSSLQGIVGQLNLRADGSRAKSKSFGTLRLLFGGNDRKGFNPNIRYCPVFTEPYDGPVKVGAGEHISLEFEMTGLAELHSPGIKNPLKPGRYVVGMGHLDNHAKPVFSTNIVDIEILPIGVSNKEELAEYLTPFYTDRVKIEAGFVSNKTEIVLGEPIFATFIVKNLADEAFTYAFGGDYRGTGRHDRFKIEAVDSEGNLLSDPKAGPDGHVLSMGGIESFRTAYPNDIASDKVNLLDFRKIERPGVYTIKCGFILNRIRHSSSHEFKIPVATIYELTVLPPDNNNVQRVIEELRLKAEERRGQPLTDVINSLCSFGGQAAVPSLVKMSTNGDLDHRIAAIKGLGQIPVDESLAALIIAEADADKSIRISALESLGSFVSDEAVDVAAAALGYPDEEIRSQAARSLGNMKTEIAIDTLIEFLPESEPKVATSILRAMGQTKSPRVLAHIVESLENKNSDCRYAAVDGLVAFGGNDAIEALKSCVDGNDIDDNDMDFREMIVKKLAESLKQPIEAEWLVPVIWSRRNARSLGDSPRLLRLYAGEKAVPALLYCLDFEEPSVRNYYNGNIICQQASCEGGLRIPWNHDMNRDGTQEEIEQNRQTLKMIGAWVDHYYKYRMDEKPMPKYPDWWGEPVDGISIRVRVNQRVWPEGMPQLIMIDVRSHPGEGSITLSNAPEALEVEINGEWYSRQPALEEATMGIDAGHGSSFHNLQLDEKWQRTSDGQPLQLIPGDYMLRVGISTTPEDQRTGLAISKPIQIEVIEVD